MSYPAPILNLSFATAKQLCHPAVSFTRSSIAPYWQSSPNQDVGGKLAYARAGVPRFGCNPVTGICKGLFIELPGNYLDSFSGQFDNTAYSRGNADVTPNVVLSLGGTVTGDKLVEDTTANDVHYIGRAVSATLNTAFGAAWVVSGGERAALLLKLSNGAAPSNYLQVIYDLSAVSAGAVATGGNASTGLAGIQALGGGRYLVWVSGIIDSTVGSGAASVQLYMMSAGSTVYTGDGSSGLYLHYESSGQWTYPPSLQPTGWETTSTSSNDIATGSHTFTVADSAATPGRAMPAGATVRIWQASIAANYMTGIVTSHSGTTLVVSITATGGSGAGIAAWMIQAGAPVTRAADAANADLTKLLDQSGNALWTGSSCTLLVDFELTSKPSGAPVIAQLFYDTNNKISIYYKSATNTFFVAVTSGGSVIFSTNLNIAVDINTRYRIVLGVSTLGHGVSINGGALISSSAPVTMPTAAARLDIMSINAVTSTSGYIKAIQLYNRRIDDSLLPSLSAL